MVNDVIYGFDMVMPIPYSVKQMMLNATAAGTVFCMCE